MMIVFHQPMEIAEIIECPFCLERMRNEERDGSAWLVCPNGCPTELEIPRKPVAAELESEVDSFAQAAGAD
jgi:hypothetical protein